MRNETILYSVKASHILFFYKYIANILILFGIYYLYENQQRLNLFSNKEHFFYLLFLLFVFFIARAIYLILLLKSTLYVITNQRIIKSYGLFNKTTVDCVLYRVREVQLIEPFIYRFFGVGNVILISVQSHISTISLFAIHNALNIKEELRSLIEERRTERGINELDSLS